MTFEDYRHIIPIQIRFSDVDRLKHINNACYHNYVELGRVQYFEEVFKSVINWDQEGFVLARTEIDHLEQTYLHDEIYCCTRSFKIGTKSLHIKNSIIRKTKNGFEETAAIKGVLVAMDYMRNESMRVPDEWRKLLWEFEGQEF
jgi:acyl-CoA thioester hydrolase